jgi:hypothetical protein
VEQRSSRHVNQARKPTSRVARNAIELSGNTCRSAPGGQA